MKGLSPEVVNVDLIKGQQRNPDYRAINPQMLIPALIEDDGRMLFQSIAIHCRDANDDWVEIFSHRLGVDNY